MHLTEAERAREEYTVTCDPAKVDRDVVAGFLAESYWSKGIPREVVARSVEGSLCFSLLREGRQVGFARIITDDATIAYVGDVFVLPELRGRGLSKWMMECVVPHPRLQGLRRWMLVTRDEHGLYERFGFRPLASPEKFMERHDADIRAGGS